MNDRDTDFFNHKKLLTLVPNERETAMITHQKLTDILKENNVRPTGLDLTREYYIFETLNKVISHINHNDMHERSMLLKSAEKQLYSTVSTWKILSNQATTYGLSKLNQNQSEIEKLKSEIEQLKQKKKDLIKQRNLTDKQYDDMLISSKNEINDLQTECQKTTQKYQQQNTSNTQILQEYKSALS
eukprot:UN07040